MVRAKVSISRVWRWVVGVRKGDLRPVEPKANGLSKSERRRYILPALTTTANEFCSESGTKSRKARSEGKLDRARSNHMYKINKELAESEGFEPPIPFRVCRFSRPVPSTTRPTLRTLLFYYRARFFSAWLLYRFFAALRSVGQPSAAVPVWTVVVTSRLGHGCRARR